MNKKEETTKVKKMGGVLWIVPESQLSKQGHLWDYDGFEGVILVDWYGDGDVWALIEGFYEQDQYKVNKLGILPNKIFEGVNTIKEIAKTIQRESIKIMKKYPKFDLGYPEIAVDTLVARDVELMARFATGA